MTVDVLFFSNIFFLLVSALFVVFVIVRLDKLLNRIEGKQVKVGESVLTIGEKVEEINRWIRKIEDILEKEEKKAITRIFLEVNGSEPRDR